MSIKFDELDQCAYANNRTIKPIRELKFYYLNDTGEGLGPSANGRHGFDMGPSADSGHEEGARDLFDNHYER